MTVTVTTTTVPGFRRALVRVLRDRPGMAGVPVSDGVTYPADLPDLVYLGDVTDYERKSAGQRVGPHAYEEEYDQQVVFSSIMSNVEDHEPVNARAFALVAELEDALADDLTADGAIRNGWAYVTGLELNVRGPEGEGLVREARIVARVHVRARLAGGTS